MSGGFRGGGAHHMRRSNSSVVDPPLIKLVEQYLYQFKHLSFINLDHMGDVIRKKSYRFSRMKNSAFKEQLRLAYEQYSNNANRRSDEFSGANIEMDDTPLNDETLRQMEGYPDSDSDMDDSTSDITTDAGVNQMKTLYTTSVKSTLNNKFSSLKDSQTPDSSSKDSAWQMERASMLSNSNAERADCISVGSSTDLSIKSDNINSKSVIAVNNKVPDKDQTVDDNESGSDLEIIEEVPNERTQNSVITNGRLAQSTVPAPRGNLTERQSTSVSPGGTTDSKGVNESNQNAGVKPSILSVSSDPKTVKESGKPARGTKRKANDLNEKGFTEDNDLTPIPKRPRKEIAVVHDSGYKLQDFAGSDKVVEEICKLLMHLKHPEVYQTLGVTPPRGFLLHGPPGTGKTLLANAIAGELQTPMLKIAGTELVSGISGESESNIRELFNQAVTIAPCIIFIDEIDSVTPRRENANKDMERRIVAQLLSCIDDLVNKEKGNQVLLIGATNRIEAIDTALRRAGRFDREICLGIPDEKSREKILAVICRDLKLETGFDIRRLAKFTPGYVGADLQALVREAAVQAVNRKLLSEDSENPEISAKVVSSTVAMDVDEEPSGIVVNENSAVKDSIIETLDNQQEGQGSSEKTVDEKSNNDDSAENKDSSNNSETPPGPVENIGKTDESELTSADTAENPEIKDSNPKENPLEQIKSNENESNVNEVLASNETETKAAENNETKDSGENSEKQQEEINKVPKPCDEEVSDPMRWIRETAPLTEDQLQDLFVTMKDFTFALKNVQPSAKREGFATVPDTTWDDIGALKNIRDELQVSILGPVKHAEAFKKLGLTTPAGVLLCGPPGCGKTLLAKAVANEAGINFISVKGPELLNMYVGESERAVRQCFLRAKNSSPCVIFFDELDALCPRRSDIADGGSSGRIVNQLLTEMDGIESRQGVYVMAASNRPDIIDPAVLRPGRLDKILFVNLPTSAERFEILKAITKNSTKPVLSEDVNLEEIANSPDCENYTGADLAALVREASIASFRELVMNAQNDTSNFNELKVYQRHFSVAFTKTKPSVGKDERTKYKLMAEKYSSIR